MRVPTIHTLYSITLSTVLRPTTQLSFAFIPNLARRSWLSTHNNHNSPNIFRSHLIQSSRVTPAALRHNTNQNHNTNHKMSTSSSPPPNPSPPPSTPPPTPPPQNPLIFGKFKIAPSQIFYTSPKRLTTAIVNLRPILPGHILVLPTRTVPKLTDLTTEEYIDLWSSVRIVQSALQSHYTNAAAGFNIAVQDGACAGQSVPHVHVHVLPRGEGDLVRNDDLYDALEEWAPTVAMSVEKMERNGGGLVVEEDKDRKSRTVEEMEGEARLYRLALLEEVEER